jgi:hypothetical protein
MPGHTKYIPFVREEDGKNTTYAVLKVRLAPKASQLSNKTIVEHLAALLTLWIAKTKEGRKAWQQSCGDFNIGDLAQVEEEFKSWILHIKLTAVGIQDFEIIGIEDNDQPINFDKVLANKSNLPDDWEKE